MEVVRKQEFEKVRLDSLKDGNCFYDNATDFQYSIKTGSYRQESNEILTVCLLDGRTYWEKENLMIIPVKAKVLIEEEG